MDHSCPSCGLAVASGTPFCSGCRAPQIRFVPPEAVEPPSHTDAAIGTALPVSTPLAWRPAFRAAFIGGIFSVFSLGLPSSLFGFGFMAGGTLAVYVYRRRVPGAMLNLGSGALLGAASGLFGFLLSSLLSAAGILLLYRQEAAQRTSFAIMDRLIQSTDPQLQQPVQQLVRHFATPEGFFVFVAISGLCTCLLFSILGGAIGANITRRSPK